MPKKDFTQVAFAVVQQATGEAPKPALAQKKEAAPKPAKTSVKRVVKKVGS